MFSKPSHYIQTVHGLSFPVYSPSASQNGSDKSSSANLPGGATSNHAMGSASDMTQAASNSDKR